MTKKSYQGSAVRTTVCINRKLWKACRRIMQEQGYDNFSAFVCELLRRKAMEKRRKLDCGGSLLASLSFLFSWALLRF